MNIESRPYFACEAHNRAAIELQRNDESAIYPDDESAIKAYIAHAAAGDAFAIETLTSAKNDPLVIEALLQAAIGSQA